MPGFPSDLAGMGDGTEKVPEFIRLAPPSKTICAVSASITQSPQTATEKEEGILPPPAYARENVRHSTSDNKCCRAASTCSVPTSA